MAHTHQQDVRSAWIEAARLRTLPLAASGSLVAAGIAAARGAFRWDIFVLMFVVSMLLQVMANFADDLGDLAHGLDTETRVGPKRGLQRGVISFAAMRRALTLTGVITLLLGCLLIYRAFGSGEALSPAVWISMVSFLVLGLCSIAAAVLYTMGPHPYGYYGLGDLMSFLFFGLVAVGAGAFLYSHELDLGALVAGVALGLPVAAVMNINNMRDSLDDAIKGKHTVANRLYTMGARRGKRLAAGREPEQIATLVAAFEHGPHAHDVVVRADKEHLMNLVGERAMRVYHAVLIYGALLCFCAALFVIHGASLATCLGAAAVCVAAMPLFSALTGTLREPNHECLDRFMAPTSMGTVALALVWSIVCAVI